MKDALVIVDDFTRMSFVYPIKDKSQYSVAAALEEHFLQQRPTSTGIKGINLFINRMVLRSDRGTEFINSSVHDLCERLGCIVEYSCPGQLGKYQNGLVERLIKEIGHIARCGKDMSVCPIWHHLIACSMWSTSLMPSLPKQIRPTARLTLQDSRRT